VLFVFAGEWRWRTSISAVSLLKKPTDRHLGLFGGGYLVVIEDGRYWYSGLRGIVGVEMASKEVRWTRFGLHLPASQPCRKRKSSGVPNG
jgi:hypothetical protein